MIGTFALPWLAAAGLTLASYPIGCALTMRLEPAGTAVRAVLAPAAGLAVVGHAALLLGLAGLLRPWAVLTLLLAANLGGRRSWGNLAQSLRAGRQGPTGLGRLAWLIPAGALLLVLPLALYPATQFDATMYHLPYAKAFATTGGAPFLSDLRFPVFPQLMEFLFAVLFRGGRDLAAQCLSVIATLLTGLLLVAWGRAEQETAAGWIAAAAFLGNPIVAYFEATAYVDPGLTLFATAAFFAFARWRQTRRGGWLALAGFFAGSAAAVKYLGLFFVAALALAAVAAGTRGRRMRAGLVFLAVAGATLAPWYLRLFFETGNPTFPYFAGLFGSSAWDLSGYQPRLFGPGTAGAAGYAGAAGDLLLRFVTLPFDLLFSGRNFDWHPPFSPFYLIAEPVLLVGAIRSARWRPLLAVAAAYMLFALTLPGDPRYLLPVCPLLSLAASSVLLGLIPVLRAPVRHKALVLAAAALLAPALLYSARELRRRGVPPASAETRDRYIATRLPLYPAILHLNRSAGSGYSLYAFYAENMAYFAQGRFQGDWFGPASFARVVDAGRTPRDLWRTLRGLGADHLLLPAKTAPPVSADAPEFQHLFRLVYADSAARVYALIL